MRSEEDALARARVLNLVDARARGVSSELLRPELQRHGLGIHLTEQEARWLTEEEEPVEADDPQAAMKAIAWALRITGSLDGDVEAIRDALDALTPSIALREEAVIRSQLALATGSAQAALHWVLGSRS